LTCHWHAIDVPLTCHLHAIDMPLTCHWHAIDMPLTRHWHAIDMPLTCHWQAIDKPLTCHWHAIDTPLTSHFDVPVKSLWPSTEDARTWAIFHPSHKHLLTHSLFTGSGPGFNYDGINSARWLIRSNPINTYFLKMNPSKTGAKTISWLIYCQEQEQRLGAVIWRTSHITALLSEDLMTTTDLWQIIGSNVDIMK